MFLGLKILGVCVIGVSCVVSATWLTNKTSENYDNSPLIWKATNKSSFPILTCSGGSTTIDISLAFRNSLGGSDTNNAASDLYLRGINLNTREEVELYETVDGSIYQEQDKWSLIVYPSGNVKLVSADLGGGHKSLSEDLTCTSKTFWVERWTYQKGTQNERSWEAPVKKITFKLKDGCNATKGKETCDIEIDSEVGLKWKEGFNPKVVF